MNTHLKDPAIESLSAGPPGPRFRKLSMDDWQQFVESRSESTTFHHRAWIEMLIAAYRLPVSIFGVTDGQQVRAAVPFLETRTLRGARKLASLPFSDFVPVLHADAASLQTLLKGVASQPLARYRAVIVRAETPGNDYPCDETWLRHELKLPECVGELRARFPASLKRNLRTAEKHQLSFAAEESAAAMSEFYRLHVLTRRKLGVPVQRWKFFRQLQQHIVERRLGFVGVVRQGSRVLAAAVFLTFNGTMIYKFGASDPQALGSRPNEFLFDQVLARAVERRFQTFDFGVSRWQDAGLRRFKMKWGSSESPAPHTYLHGAPSPSHGEESLPRRVAADVIRRSPTVVCRALGAALYRYSQ